MVLATDMNKHFEYLAKFQTTILATDNVKRYFAKFTQ